jgi:hypothetical protein
LDFVGVVGAVGDHAVVEWAGDGDLSVEVAESAGSDGGPAVVALAASAGFGFAGSLPGVGFVVFADGFAGAAGFVVVGAWMLGAARGWGVWVARVAFVTFPHRINHWKYWVGLGWVGYIPGTSP